MKNNWPFTDTDRLQSLLESTDFEEIWQDYLAAPENKVDKELKIFPEPSVQCGMGGMFIFDESGESELRFEGKMMDFQEWCYKELEMARESADATEYAEKYKAFLKEFLGI